MSSYLVEKNHLDFLVNAARDWGICWLSGDEWKTIGQPDKSGNTMTPDVVGEILRRGNMRGVSERYNGEAPEDLLGPIDGSTLGTYRFTPAVYPDRGHAIAVVKACHCLAYQSCDAEDYDTSEACALLKSIESAAVRKLPGYEDAEWGAPEPQSNMIRLTDMIRK